MILLRAAITLLLALALGGGAALAQDSSPGAGESPAPGAISSPAVGAESPAPGTGSPGPGTEGTQAEADVEVGAVEYAFLGVPENVDVGTSFSLRNDGQEVHEFAVVRRNEGTDQSVEELLQMGDEAFTLVTFVGVIFASPGETSPDTLTISDPGRYIAVCFIPQGTTEIPAELAGTDSEATGSATEASPVAGAGTGADASPATGTDAGTGADSSPGVGTDPSPGTEAQPGASPGVPHVALGMLVEFSVGDEAGMDAGVSPGIDAGASPGMDAGSSPAAGGDAEASPAG